MEYLFSTTPEQDLALKFFASKDGITEAEVFQKLVSGIMKSYEKQSIETAIKNSTLLQKEAIYTVLTPAVEPMEEIIK